MTPTLDPEPDREEVLEDLDALAALARLQRATREHDWTAAMQAEARLEELGYVVRLVRPLPPEVHRVREESL